MLNDAIGNVHHMVCTQLKQPKLRRTQTAANGQARTQPESMGIAGYGSDCRQTMCVRERIESVLYYGGDSRFIESWAGGAGRTM
jgi:hypothetical protein